MNFQVSMRARSAMRFSGRLRGRRSDLPHTHQLLDANCCLDPVQPYVRKMVYLKLLYDFAHILHKQATHDSAGRKVKLTFLIFYGYVELP